MNKHQFPAKTTADTNTNNKKVFLFFFLDLPSIDFIIPFQINKVNKE